VKGVQLVGAFAVEHLDGIEVPREALGAELLRLTVLRLNKIGDFGVVGRGRHLGDLSVGVEVVLVEVAQDRVARMIDLHDAVVPAIAAQLTQLGEKLPRSTLHPVEARLIDLVRLPRVAGLEIGEVGGHADVVAQGEAVEVPHLQGRKLHPDHAVDPVGEAQSLDGRAKVCDEVVVRRHGQLQPFGRRAQHPVVEGQERIDRADGVHVQICGNPICGVDDPLQCRIELHALPRLQAYVVLHPLVVLGPRDTTTS